MILLFLAFFIFIFSPSAHALVSTNAVVTAQAVTNAKQNFVQGTDAADTYKTLYTAGVNGSKCVGMSVANNDGSATHQVTFEITNGGNTYHVGQVVTVSPGTNNTNYVMQNAFSPSIWAGLAQDGDQNGYIQLVNGDVLKAAYHGALTSTDEIDILGTCGDF